MRPFLSRLLLLAGCALFTACSSRTSDHALADAQAASAAADNVGVEAGDAQTALGGARALDGGQSHNPHRAAKDPYYLAGQTLSEWHVDEWANSSPLTLAGLRGKVLVVRFWTDSPDELDDSLRSLRALERLKEEFAGQPVTFVGIYHSKGSLVETPWDEVERRVAENMLSFPVAYDRQWTTLNEWWRRRFDHLPTTPTFVINAAGKVAFVHPGPAYYPSYRDADVLCDADYRDLRDAIHAAMPQQLADR